MIAWRGVLEKDACLNVVVNSLLAVRDRLNSDGHAATPSLTSSP